MVPNVWVTVMVLHVLTRSCCQGHKFYRDFSSRCPIAEKGSYPGPAYWGHKSTNKLAITTASQCFIVFPCLIRLHCDVFWLLPTIWLCCCFRVFLCFHGCHTMFSLSQLRFRQAGWSHMFGQKSQNMCLCGLWCASIMTIWWTGVDETLFRRFGPWNDLIT